MKRFIQIMLLSIFPVIFEGTVKAQMEFLVNPSLEGDDIILEPYDWETCREENANRNDFYNDPNFSECRDFFANHICNIDGENFCLLRTRSDNYGDVVRAGTYEHISSELIEPFEKNATYHLKIWLVSILKYDVSDQVAPDTAFPLRFQVFGAYDYCIANDEDKLTDTLITNIDWKLYSFDLKPEKDYDHIYFRVYWDDKIMQELGWKYNGMMLLDGSSIALKCQNENLPTVTTYFKYYEDVYLHASDGISYSWDNTSKLSGSNIQSPRIIEYDSLFNVSITDIHNCRYNETHRVLLHCDSLYLSRNEIHPIKKVPYGETIQLAPEIFVDGIASIMSINWSPPDYLSCVQCIETKLTVIEDMVYTVEYTDDMNCNFSETFPVQLEIKIPNVITPGNDGSGDGINDVFKIQGLPGDASIYIFHKSGTLIFEAHPYNASNWWDGTDMNGNNVPAGTYWFALTSPSWPQPVRGFIFVKR